MLEILIVVGILVIDQLTKYLSDVFLSPLGTSVPVIEGVFHFTSAHNTGAAWGILQGKRAVFLILTLFVCLYILLYLIRARKRLTVFARVILSLLLAGAIGNAIDRLVFSSVRDFFDFCLINFPIFNVADCSLTVGCILLIIDMLFMKERSMFEVKLSLRDEPEKPAVEKEADDGAPEEKPAGEKDTPEETGNEPADQ